MKKIAILSFFILINYCAFSQNITVNSKIDTNKILIGDRIKLNIELSQPKNLKVQFPILVDTLTKNVEILSQSKIDTTISADLLNLKQELYITSFDSGTQVIPGFKFAFNIDSIYDTIKTRELFFDVLTVPPDTTVKDIKDIKPPFEIPYSFKEFIPYILIGLLVIIIAVLVYLYFKKRKKKEPLIKLITKPIEPAHIIAIRELNILKDKKLWQNDKIKEYYTELSEIIRKYIENRFDVFALEHTSEEILSSFENSTIIDRESFEILKQILSNSDLVKFAKYFPLPNEHDSIFKISVKFVENTKIFIDNNSEKSINENSHE